MSTLLQRHCFPRPRGRGVPRKQVHALRSQFNSTRNEEVRESSDYCCGGRWEVGLAVCGELPGAPGCELLGWLASGIPGVLDGEAPVDAPGAAEGELLGEALEVPA